MTLIRIFVLLLLIIFVQSCFDKNSPKPIVGKTYLLSDNDDTYLIFSESNVNDGGYTFDRIVNENVLNMMGNDSVIYVKTKIKDEHNYYIIKHKNGNKVIKIEAIDSINFGILLKGKTFKYLYSNNIK